MEGRHARDNNWFRAGEDKLLLNRIEARGTYEVGQPYALRVRAVNAAGPGPWSIESDQLLCKYAHLKPKVSFRGFASKEIVNFKAGDTLFVEADIEGVYTLRDFLLYLESGKYPLNTCQVFC